MIVIYYFEWENESGDSIISFKEISVTKHPPFACEQ